jgi:hypothetical protein
LNSVLGTASSTSAATTGTAEPTPAHPRDLLRPYWAGSALGIVVLVFVLLGGSFSVLQSAPAGAIYDGQAHSLLRGRWDVPAAVAGIESFSFNDRTYVYFGPFPSLLRLPVAAFTDRFDGRLGGLSILVAVIVLVIACGVLVVEIAERSAPVPVGGQWTDTSLFAFGMLLTGGSVVTFLAFRGDVYNEAIAWGLATAVAANAALLRGVRNLDIRYVALAGACATAAVLSRPTIGASAVGPIACVLVAASFTSLARRFDLSAEVGRRRFRLVLAVTLAVPIAAFAAVQLAKFGTLMVRPSDHVVNRTQPSFAAFLARHGDSYFSPSYLPANFLSTTVWPSRIHFDAGFPWLRPVDSALGPNPLGAVFLGRSWTGSLLVTQPILFVLAVIGIAALGRPGGRGRSSTPGRPRFARDLALVGAGASIGYLATLLYAYQYHRFLADAFPLVLLLAIVGMFALTAWLAHGAGRAARRSTIAASVALLAWSMWVNPSTALLAQTERAWAPTPAAMERRIDLQATFGASTDVVRFRSAADLTPPDRIGRVAVIGDCDALLASAGSEGFDPLWWPIELGPRFRVELDVDAHRLAADRNTIARDPATGASIVVVQQEDQTAAVEVRSASGVELLPIPSDNNKVALEFDPVWKNLRLSTGDTFQNLPWLTGLDRPAGQGIAVVAGDNMSLCRRLTSN